jgi:serine/threonine protein kinase/tetratricopeptide (TPR) repeat protein
MATTELSTAESLSAETAALVDRLADLMAGRWRAGEFVKVETLLADHPDLSGEPAAVMELLAEELNLREQFGRPADETELRRRFPEWDRELDILLDCQHLLTSRTPAPRFPAAGEAIGGFRLLHELGRGSHGRVFLATQPALADRPVVLKLTPAAGDEHLALARLQHTHIVPLYSAHTFPAAGLRGLCLPYFGGATLADVLGKLADRPRARRTGRDIRQAIRPTDSEPSAGPARRALDRATYVQAMCWIGACLADALAYAADRGLLHLDLKPSNVLLTAEGQPMLLDFHLARGPLRPGEPPPRWLGGTPAHMAPEHAAAVAAVRDGRPVPQALDGRADVYGLGLLLVETLGAGPGDERFPTRAWRRANPHVSVGLADLLAKCLAPDPADRYPSAADVASDLRCHLSDLPLRGVANRSPVERWRKWRRRRPLALPRAGLFAGAVATGAVVLTQFGRQAEQARVALGEGTDYLQGGRYLEAVEALKAGGALADGLPFHGDLRAQLRKQRRRATAGLAARDLHDLCERVRPLYAVADLPERQARVVESCCRDVWAKRARLMDDFDPSTDLVAKVRSDLLDLAVLSADLHTRLAAPAAVAAAQQHALAILDEAEQLFGPSCVVAWEKQALAISLGRPAVAEAAARRAAELPPRTAWEHYTLGRAYLRTGDAAAAAAEMDHALELQPQDLWPNYYKGACAFQSGQFEDAVTAFSVCVALAPNCAWCYFNRGLALVDRGRVDAARADFNHALRLDPEMAPAALNRGVLSLRAGRPDEALADFRLALDHGANVAAVCYQSALAHLAREDKPAARESLHRALEHDPRHQPARELLARIMTSDR